jgi:PAS domain S-box-containing protein
VETDNTKQFADFLRHSGQEGVLVLDNKGNVLSANRAAELLLGYGVGQLTNIHVSEFWTGGYTLPRATTERTRPEPERAREEELRRRNGEVLPVALSAAPFGASEDGQLLSFVSRAELDRLNEALVHAQRLAGIGTLTASVAHELTNPISIITATCTNLRDELEEETLGRDELARYVELIEQSAYRCARIVEVLRNYAHNVGRETGDGAAIAITSPAAVVQDALMMVEQQFRKQAHVTVELDLEPALQTIFCDHHRVAQVLINLLTNARDAMQPEGGVVRVRFWSPDPAREPVLAEQIRHLPSLRANGHNAPNLFAFAVSDTGTGIDPTILPRIFEPFFTTKPVGQGTGLGLYIAEGIVRGHGGRIWAENNPDGGATVTVVLPRKQ